MTLVNLLILALATWRLAYMLVKERGPYQVFETLRKWGFLVHVLGCVHCTSIWCAPALWLLTFTPLWPLVWFLAISGLALMLHRYTGFHVE
jgi:hypothetical protein